MAELRETITEYEFMQWTRYYAAKAQTMDLEQKAAEAKMGRG